ncbi:MAG: peptidoglycan-binding protein, partial [Devosiaceae bacterium]|nr:peptidoglycan-binding protein [Devosiaceae bacterium]
DEAIGELQIELLALYENISQALDPNFSKLEMRIKELSDNIKETPSKKSIERLEGQVQELISNSNQTNEQLDIITKRTNVAIPSTQSDFNNDVANPTQLKEISVAISQLSKAFDDQASDENLNNVQYGIEQLDDRLAKLEATTSEASISITKKSISKEEVVSQPAPLKNEQTSKTLQSKLNNSLVNASAQNVEDALEDIRRSFLQDIDQRGDDKSRIQENFQNSLQETTHENTIAQVEQNADESHLINNDENNYEANVDYKASVDNGQSEQLSSNQHQAQNIPLIDNEYDFSDDNEEELGHDLTKEFDSIIHDGFDKESNEQRFDDNAIQFDKKQDIQEKPPQTPITPQAPVADKAVIAKDNLANEKPAKPSSIFAQAPSSSFDDEAIEVAPERQEIKQISINNFANQPVKNSSKNTFIEAARRASMLQNKPLQVEEKQSFIAKGLSRFKSDNLSNAINKTKKQTQNNTQKENDVNEKNDKSSQTDKGNSIVNPISLLKRLTKNNKDKTKPANATLEEMPSEQNEALKQDKTPNKESFIFKYRRSFLLASALVVVIVLSLNLLTKRSDVSDNPQLATNNDIEKPAIIEEPISAIIPKEETQDNISLDTSAAPNPMIDNTSTGAIGPIDELPISQVRIINQAIPLSLTSSSTQENLSETQIGEKTANLTNITDELIEIDTSKFIKDFTPLATALELPNEKIGPLALREAAANGDSRAQFEVGAIYGEGKALTQDFASAAIWFERAAANGFAPASLRLGGLYESGKGVEKNYEQAKLWYFRSAEAGNRMAMHNLASLYAGGELGEQKFLQAIEWFERAAKYGLTDSQFNLGMLHARGLGVKQDLETAYFWFSLAAKNGDKDALKAKDDVARSLNSDIVMQVQAKLDSWEREEIDLKANFAPIGTWAKDFNPGPTIKSANVVEKVQTALKRLGFDIGEPDGLMGPRTKAAIKEFEKATGMSLSGAVNPRLLAVLGSQPV